MISQVHVLGSPISHHNETVLKFFQSYHEKYLKGSEALTFLVAVASLTEMTTEQMAQKYPNLTIQRYPGKKALAQALLEHSQANNQTHYFLHGQFNPKIWFDILLGKIDGKRVKWHVWGADLYEEEKTLKYKLFYMARRLAQGKVGQIFATKGDIRVLKSRLSQPNTSTLYFPTKMDLSLSPSASDKQNRVERLKTQFANKPKTILLGNSGDKTNNHLLGLTQIFKTFGADVNIIIPMGYPLNNASYIDKVKAHARDLFGDNKVTVLEEKLEFAAYLECLNTCDLAYFLFERQQGIGTISLCIQLGVPFVLHPFNAFIDDLNEENIPHLTIKDKMTHEQLYQTQTKLSQVNLSQINFFEPNYIQGWHTALGLLKEDERDIS